MNLILIIFLLILTVVIGSGIVFLLHKKENKQLIKLLLALSGGFLLSIAFIHFIPELYESSTINIGLFILCGFLIQLLLEFFSGGIEHGHVHHHKKQHFPIAIILALGVHSLVEGIPLGHQLNGGILATHAHHGNDYSLLIGILLHRIPVAIALTTLLKTTELNMAKIFAGLTIFALTAPIGVLIGYLGGSVVNVFNFDILLAVVVGMFLHISTTIIFETSENHKFNLVKLITIILGGSVAYLLH